MSFHVQVILHLCNVSPKCDISRDKMHKLSTDQDSVCCATALITSSVYSFSLHHVHARLTISPAAES